MVHRFALDQIHAEQVFCDQYVFEHIRMLPGSGMAGEFERSRTPSSPVIGRPSNYCLTPTTRFDIHCTSPTSAVWSVHRRKRSSIDTRDSGGARSKAERHAHILGIDDTALRKGNERLSQGPEMERVTQV
jgi:hypothetical protein